MIGVFLLVFFGGVFFVVVVFVWVGCFLGWLVDFVGFFYCDVFGFFWVVFVYGFYLFLFVCVY